MFLHSQTFLLSNNNKNVNIFENIQNSLNFVHLYISDILKFLLNHSLTATNAILKTLRNYILDYFFSLFPYHFNTVLLGMPSSRMESLPFWFSDSYFVCIFHLIQYIYHNLLILLNLFNIIIIGERYKLLSFFFCNLLQIPVTSSPVVHNIVLIILYWSFVTVSEQVLHSCKSHWYHWLDMNTFL
jgi:hypothetical protein